MSLCSFFLILKQTRAVYQRPMHDSEYFFCGISQKSMWLPHQHQSLSTVMAVQGKGLLPWRKDGETHRVRSPVQPFSVSRSLSSRTLSETQTSLCAFVGKDMPSYWFLPGISKSNDSGPRAESSDKLCLKLALLFLSGAKMLAYISTQ